MGIVLTIVVVVLVLAGAAAYLRWQAPGFAGRFGAKGPNPRRLRLKYGREYDRLFAQHGNQDAVLQELTRRETDRAALTITPVGEQERERLAAEWTTAQAGFLDDPGRATRRAQQLIGEVLAVRGYPAQDAERQLALASVDHPRSLSLFRDGHELLQRSNTGAPDVDSTEQLRQAMLNFRAFFDDLVGADSSADNSRKVLA